MKQLVEFLDFLWFFHDNSNHGNSVHVPLTPLYLHFLCLLLFNTESRKFCSL